MRVMQNLYFWTRNIVSRIWFLFGLRISSFFLRISFDIWFIEGFRARQLTHDADHIEEPNAAICQISGHRILFLILEFSIKIRQCKSLHKIVIYSIFQIQWNFNIDKEVRIFLLKLTRIYSTERSTLQTRNFSSSLLHTLDDDLWFLDTMALTNDISDDGGG